MNIPPLCIIQARLHSTRLRNKMLLTLNGETLIARGWRIACEAFGADHCIVGIPHADAGGPLATELDRIGARWGHADAIAESDVLGRFWHIAHVFRWHPDSVIIRYTPDDPFKTVEGLRLVANGERLPVEIGGEAFTLAMLDKAQREQASVDDGNAAREHITHALFSIPALPAPKNGMNPWSIDTYDDYRAARLLVEGN